MTEQKIPLVDRIRAIREKHEYVKRFLDQRVWTPVVGALLACGFAPSLDCDEIPIGESDDLQIALRIVRKWQEQSKPPHVSPREFLAWCGEEAIDTPWIREFQNSERLRSRARISRAPVLLSRVKLESPAQASERDVEFKAGSSASRGASVDGKPPLLPTLAIAVAFDGIGRWGEEGWTADQWKKNLTELAWPRPARVGGGRGRGKTATWDPVLLARLAIEARGIRIKAFRERFQTVKSLAKWRTEWQQFELAVLEYGDVKNLPRKP
ncbi:hypothetical protein QCE63_01600 [Caballeronia sp. LZ065]|uniref:hypothetical protein n=1 Tax=Caballeronia sp. LZ065 TaxID=3038571 RepID=UPI002864A74B|nr:hypothetical protein [Caballeronia sp. LZ065]MDR5778121.1 hypothetical protein [Caballeronia sp. LZ065]